MDDRVQAGKGRAWVPAAAPLDPANHSPLSAEEEALVSEGLEKRLKGCKRAAKLGLMCWPPNSQGRRPRPAAVGGGPRGSHTTSNALQLSPLLSLCWFGENKNQI